MQDYVLCCHIYAFACFVKKFNIAVKNGEQFLSNKLINMFVLIFKTHNGTALTTPVLIILKK